MTVSRKTNVVALYQLEMLYMYKVTYFICNTFYPTGAKTFNGILPYFWILLQKSLSNNPGVYAAILNVKLLAVSI